MLVQGNYYISFTILSESMEDPSFKLGKGIHVLNVILEYFYVGLILMCFLLALGNRPQGSKWFYTFAFLGFAVITVYMTVRLPCSFAALSAKPCLISVLPRFRFLRSSLQSRVFRISSLPTVRWRLPPCSQTQFSETLLFRSWLHSVFISLLLSSS